MTYYTKFVNFVWDLNSEFGRTDESTTSRHILMKVYRIVLFRGAFIRLYAFKGAWEAQIYIMDLIKVIYKSSNLIWKFPSHLTSSYENSFQIQLFWYLPEISDLNIRIEKISNFEYVVDIFCIDIIRSILLRHRFI